MTQDEVGMRAALEMARKALEMGELPVGAAIFQGGTLISVGCNAREATHDPTAHAEIVAIRGAAQALGRWRLTDCTLYVTLEPCPMCAGAVVQARIARIVYGAEDARAGCTGSLYRLTEDPAFNHFAPADGGVLREACQEMLDRFFEARRARPVS
ncbi:MAG: tRNA adenosine(34) deaminase TadA [Clostridia bacterium]